MEQDKAAGVKKPVSKPTAPKVVEAPKVVDAPQVVVAPPVVEGPECKHLANLMTTVRPAVARIWHIQASQGQFLALTFKYKSLQCFGLFPLRAQQGSARVERRRDDPQGAQSFGPPISGLEVNHGVRPRPCPSGANNPRGATTEGPWWGHPMLVLGALCSFLEPFCGHLSPKIDKVSEELTLRYPHEEPCVEARGRVLNWLRIHIHNLLCDIWQSHPHECFIQILAATANWIFHFGKQAYHTVAYGPFIKRQLSSRNCLYGLMLCNFGRLSLEL